MLLHGRSTVKLAFFAGLAVLYALGFLFFFSGLHLRFLASSVWNTVPKSPAPDNSALSGPPRFTTTYDEIPKKLWYKVGPQGLNKDTVEWTESCIRKNPDYRYEYLTDRSSDLYVAETFASRPDLVSTYFALTIPILKADILRYLLLYSEGGVWSDLDASCEDTPIDEWVPERYKSSADLVVGWEFDAGFSTPITRQFATWTIMAKPGVSHIWMVVEDILHGLWEAAVKHNGTVEDLRLDMVGDVVDMTGPRRFTRSVLKSLRLDYSSGVGDASISELVEPKLVDNVLIMPGYSFALATNHYDQRQSMGSVLVTHHYAGSWKNEQGGELI